MIKDITEVCPHCQAEVSMKWDTDEGFVATCPTCGQHMFLCDECTHADDNKCQRCDWQVTKGSDGRSTCFRGVYAFGTYKVRCYTKEGDLDHEEFFEAFEDALEKRKSWGAKIGLRPEPSISDFAKYPTIWIHYEDEEKDRWHRLMGY